MDVTIIIVNWNTRDILRDCLKSIYAQTRNITFEVIVVDNASADNSVQMIRTEFPQIILIENADNRGFAAGNNQGLEIARGRYVLLLNPDTIVLEGAIQKTVIFAEQHPKVAVIGIRNDRPGGRLIKNCFQFASVQNLIISSLGLHRLFPQSRFFGRERLLWWDYQSVREVDVVAGCCMLVRREAIDRAGMMDEAYFMYGEEMDWCWRFKKAGWKILYYPDARIIHYGGMSAAQNPVEMRAAQQKSFLYFIKKRQGLFAMYIARYLFFVSGLVRLGYWGCRWIFSFGETRMISAQKVRQALKTSFSFGR
ncbi:MAG: glycosyltransferase family 2 protein [Sedimentisphaerales bacterium]|nr:glycosyltransferase family 2 protein [Sedimentisphaerales bacterium]